MLGRVLPHPQVGLIDRLSEAGCRVIEAASFVSPKWVPQMADSSEVMAKIRRAPGVKYSALTPNVQGLEAALEARVSEVGTRYLEGFLHGGHPDSSAVTPDFRRNKRGYLANHCTRAPILEA